MKGRNGYCLVRKEFPKYGNTHRSLLKGISYYTLCFSTVKTKG